MKIYKRVLILASLALVVVSCGSGRTREQKLSAMLGEMDSPFFVASMNIQNLMDKSEIMEEGTIPFTYMEVLGFFLKEDVTGIDYKTNAQIVVTEGESFSPNFYGIFKIGDEEKFTDLIETEAGATIVEEDGIKYFIKDSEMYCAAWNEEFAVISNIPVNLASLFSGNNDKEGKKMINKTIAIINAAEEGEVNEKWVTFLGKDADLAMHYDGLGFYDYYEMMTIDEESNEETKELIQGMSYEIFANFENGEMTIDVVSDLSEDLLEKLAFVPSSGVSEEMLAYGKSADPITLGSYNSDAKGAMDYFEETSATDYENVVEEAEAFGLSVEDLKKSLNGQFVYMVDDVVTTTELIDFGYGEAFEREQTYPLFGIVIGLDDASYIKDKMAEMMQPSTTTMTDEMAAEMPEMEMWENGVIKMDEVMMVLNDQVLFVSNDTSWVNLIAEGSGVKASNPDGVVNEKAFGMHVDLSKSSSVKELGQLLDQYHGIMEDLSISMDLQGGKIVLRMVDKGQNSLRIITEAVGAALSDFEKMSNPTMEQELEQAVQDTKDAFDDLENDINEAIEEIDFDEVEDAINGAFDKLNK